MNAYFVTGSKDGAEPIHRTFYDLALAKRAGEKLYAGGLADKVVIRRERGKTLRLVRDDRCTRAKRGTMTWTR
jgi:hypothetical protein